ncbi:MAG TPA: hypothetical protein DDZ22_02290, partial [Massilia sp.]|nr:hypothetical protein [Massilia sp.]
MKNNRIGLILVVSSLAVIALVVSLLLKRQHTEQLEQLRAQGLGTVRSLAVLPADVLLPPQGQPSVLASLLAMRGNPDVAYAAISGEGGRNLIEGDSPGAI